MLRVRQPAEASSALTASRPTKVSVVVAVAAVVVETILVVHITAAVAVTELAIIRRRRRTWGQGEEDRHRGLLLLRIRTTHSNMTWLHRPPLVARVALVAMLPQ